MGTRYPNPRLVKAHRSYDVTELSRLFKCHKNTILAWRKTGLDSVDDRKPFLFEGIVVRTFLERRRVSARRPCGPHGLFCVRCREAKAPALGMVDYIPVTETTGDLRGLCPTCDGIMHRRANMSRLVANPGSLDITFAPAPPTLRGSAQPILNCDLRQIGGTR